MKSPSASSYPTSAGRYRPAFTLVEVLTVIAIISILMTAGAIGLGNLTAGKGTSTAIAAAESLMDEARTIAVSKRCRARFMVDNNANSENYLRRIVIAHQKIDPATGEPSGGPTGDVWVIANRGYMMPKGVFFSKEYSLDGAGAKITPTAINGADITTNYQGNYVMYEFNAEGIAASPGASFIIGSGTRPPGGGPKTVPSAAKDFAGFVIWRNGSTSTYRSPEQMPGVQSHSSNANF